MANLMNHVVVFAFLASICGSVQTQSGVTPIQKVLTLMSDLLTTCKTNKQDEATEFAKFDQWCKDQTGTKKGEIKDSEELGDKLKAEIEKAGVLIKSTDERIKELEQDVGRWNRDTKSSRDVRNKEKQDFSATNTDYGESIDALTLAISTLKKQDFTRAQAQMLQTTLIQVQSRHRSAPPMPAELMNTLTALSQEASDSSEVDKLSESQKRYLMSQDSSESSDSSDSQSLPETVTSAPADSSVALTQNQAETEDSSQQEPAGYEFQSGGVIDMLGKLKDQFTTEKTNLEKEELNAQNAYDKLAQQLSDNIDGAETELSQKKALLTKTQQAKADKEGDQSSTTKEVDGFYTYLRDTTEMCLLKSNNFKSRQKLRVEEITAISKAVDIIGGDDVKGSGERNLPAFIQVGSQKATVFAHLRSDLMQSPMQGKIAVFLSERAHTLGSALLLDVAQRVEADPFTKVKKMIKDLIIKLMEESTSETEHKGWCDTELTTNTQTRDKKTEDIDSLNSDIEDLSANVAKLGQEMSELMAKVKALDQAMIDATNDRMASKATNTKTIKEAKAAISAVEQALAVLKDFYAKSAEATAFVQAGFGTAEAGANPYTGDEGGAGVVGMLEVILSDFVRLDSETTASEAQEEEQYRNFMFESARDRALLAGMMGLQEQKKSDKESALHTAKDDFKTTQESLDKAVKYYEKLKPDCVDSGISYAERVKKREEEIQSLQEAVKILNQ